LFGPPTPDNMGMSFSFDFKLKDNIPNPHVGPKKKGFLEKFSESMYCKLDDIIEDNGQEIYTCHNGYTTVTRKLHSRSWNYDTFAIYDAKKDT
jgi:hypothetical protein